MIKDFLMSGVMPKAGQLLPWKEQIADTVKSIYKTTSKPIMICLSGGIDSEIIAREFLESQNHSKYIN
jgi:asparagine synthetase B (glutamine-hydrolysing)